MQQMMITMRGMIPDESANMQNIAQNMMAAMQQQMSQMLTCMGQMNQIALSSMQQMLDQNCMMMNQFLAAMQQMTGPAACQDQEETGEPEEAKTAAEEAASEE